MVTTSEARTVPRLAVDSSNLKTIGYAEDRRILAIEFNSGEVFHYRDVPLEVFEQLGRSDSMGKFYTKQIKGKFTSEPMTGRCAQCGAFGFIGESCGDCGTGVVRRVERQRRP